MRGGERLGRWMILGVWLAFVVATIACADEGWAPRFFATFNRVPFGDKVGHFFIIGTLAWLLNRALRGRKISIACWRVYLGGTIVACLMTVEEFSQIWISTREFALSDLAANYAGVFFAGLLTRMRVPEPAMARPKP